MVLESGSSPAILLPLADSLGLPISERLELLTLERLKLARGMGASYASYRNLCGVGEIREGDPGD